MKLIIDIPERIFDTIQADEMISREQLAILQMHILNGTPLDDVKDIIRDKKTAETDVAREYYNLGLGDAINILDYVGKAESEE